MNTPFDSTHNAICWRRELSGDFSEIVEKIQFEGNMIEVNPADLRALDLSENGQLAREIILNDMKLLEESGASPVLNLIKQYESDDFFFPTDVYS